MHGSPLLPETDGPDPDDPDADAEPPEPERPPLPEPEPRPDCDVLPMLVLPPPDTEPVEIVYDEPDGPDGAEP